MGAVLHQLAAMGDRESSDSNVVVCLQNGVDPEDAKALWVFGYGSLCWNPGFTFEKAITGHVKGYSRKFWQGNSTHRGTEQKPGRVATLVEDEESAVYGVAFLVSGEAALPYLTQRECKLGGYVTEFTTFFPSHDESPFMVVLYIATPNNSLWLGDAPLHKIADQITNSSGSSGHNVEYLIRLAEFMRHHFPDQEDEHLFRLEYLVKKNISEQKKCLENLMGNGNLVRFVRSSPQAQRQEGHNERIDSFQFTSRVPEKVLRCLNI